MQIYGRQTKPRRSAGEACWFINIHQSRFQSSVPLCTAVLSLLACCPMSCACSAVRMAHQVKGGRVHWKTTSQGPLSTPHSHHGGCSSQGSGRRASTEDHWPCSQHTTGCEGLAAVTNGRGGVGGVMWERLQYHLTKGSLLTEQHNHLYVCSTLAHLVVWPPLQDLGRHLCTGGRTGWAGSACGGAPEKDLRHLKSSNRVDHWSEELHIIDILQACSVYVLHSHSPQHSSRSLAICLQCHRSHPSPWQCRAWPADCKCHTAVQLPP